MQFRARMARSMEEHAAILDAIRAGDSEATTLRHHINIQGEKFHDLLSNYEKSPHAADH